MKEYILKKIKEKQNETSADTKIAGTDYQFLYFLKYLLELKPSEEVGFEVEDDIHVKKADGSIVLVQVKHTVQQKKNEEPVNLTDKSTDLWKTISNWVDLIRIADINQKEFLEKYFFILVTNKSVALDTFPYFISNGGAETEVRNEIEKILNETKNDTLKKYIENLMSLEEDVLNKFINKLRIHYDEDNVCTDIAESIKYRLIGAEKFVEETIDGLIGSLFKDKYLIIKENNKLLLSYEDFTQKYRYCFKRGYPDRKLPKRSMEYNLPSNLEEQMFIKQLLDIDDIVSGSSEIKKYTVFMLEFKNRIFDWLKNQDILPLEFDKIKELSIDTWQDEFKHTYRSISKKIGNGAGFEELNEEINDLAANILHEIRKFKIKIDDIEIFDKEMSNGCFYYLTEESELGWHYNWEEKYK
ncbi:hypothetical protein [Acinetobacter haemolyticus]|uniref:hypothetical protein n=1 Tax=Acinetobacter haemolyticus TaxID=29430 RepID=UPI0024DE66A0|nr:hypothetical protein [Acinetobacter haemolyticus]